MLSKLERPVMQAWRGVELMRSEDGRWHAAGERWGGLVRSWAMAAGELLLVRSRSGRGARSEADRESKQGQAHALRWAVGKLGQVDGGPAAWGRRGVELEAASWARAGICFGAAVVGS
jgi:hypothetical protein